MITKHCDGISRRDFVRVGGLTAMGVGLGNFFQLQSASSTNQEAATHARAKSCILVWLDGGPSHIETLIGVTITELRPISSNALTRFTG